jgi:GNAT superfamily N-acetyltransferase
MTLPIKAAVEENLVDIYNLYDENRDSWGHKDENHGTMEYFRELMHDPFHRLYIIYYGATLIGVCLFEWNTHKDKIQIKHLLVKQAYRRQGYGTRFIKIIESFGLGQFICNVPEGNLFGQLFMRAHDYKCTHIKKNYFMDEKGNKTGCSYRFQQCVTVCNGV